MAISEEDIDSHRVYEYNGQRIFVFSPSGGKYRKFSIAFDIESGRMVWEDIEIWE